MCIATADQKDQKNRTKKKENKLPSYASQDFFCVLISSKTNRDHVNYQKKNRYEISSEAIQFFYIMVSTIM